MKVSKNGLMRAGVCSGLLASVFMLSGCNAEASSEDTADKKIASTKSTSSLHTSGGGTATTTSFNSSVLADTKMEAYKKQLHIRNKMVPPSLSD